MAVKKKAAKKKVTKKTSAAPEKKLPAIKERFSKTAILSEIAENTELSRKQVAAVLDELSDLTERHIKKRACGEFVIPGLMKVITVRKPATKARKNVPNPFKPGELMDVAAKPARTLVKVRPLKKLKEMAEK
ncbi:MAG: HU family DNA-binding protein [Gammaproteobacteria bacterium]|nr:HU family DNA-binding protein [Gammaproteobacteria bacterium]